jgi:predicted class III extradiol MEMO1 family dioxygenase
MTYIIEWMQKAAEENAFDENITKRIKAIIAPHAGYRYISIYTYT